MLSRVPSSMSSRGGDSRVSPCIILLSGLRSRFRGVLRGLQNLPARTALVLIRLELSFDTLN